MSMIISGSIPPAAAERTAAAGPAAAPEIRQIAEERSARARRPAVDEYVPEEPREMSGRYWPGKDEAGNPRICFDDPEAGDPAQARNRDQDREAAAPGKESAGGKKAETCTGSTDRVDREIEKLKKEKERLEQQLKTETDETRRQELEAKLAKVEDELRKKDNDTYRRQHTVFS